MRQEDRADHDRGGTLPSQYAVGAKPSESPQVPTARCGSPKMAATKSAGSPPAGAVTEFAGPRRCPERHHRGAGRRAVVHRVLRNKIGRITTAGAVTEYTVPTGGANPTGITAGPDGALWFTESNANKIGRITTGGTLPPNSPFLRAASTQKASPQVPTTRCGSPSRSATRSAASRPAERLPSSLFLRAVRSKASPRDRTTRCGSSSRTSTRSGAFGPACLPPPTISTPKARATSSGATPAAT